TTTWRLNSPAITLLAHLSGSKVCFVEVAGKLGAGLAEEGEAAMVAFAVDWLASLYRSGVKQAVRRTHATGWEKGPWGLGGASGGGSGGQVGREGPRRAATRAALVRRRSRAREFLGDGGGCVGGGRACRRGGAKKTRARVMPRFWCALVRNLQHP